MKRKDVAEAVFKYIREKTNMQPVDVRYGNGYFIFDKGEDGVVHFQIKGLHGWKFGMWINLNENELKDKDGTEYPALQFFCQHKDNIDKFKPSRSFFNVEFKLKEIIRWLGTGTYPFSLFEIKEILMMIKRHPLVAFTMDGNAEQYYSKSYIAFYIHTKFYNKKRKLKECWRNFSTKIWHGWKVWFVNQYKVVDKCKLIDQNTGGWKTYPRYVMMIHFNKISDDEETQQKAEIKVLDTWFIKDSYKNMHLNITREGIEGRYSYQMVKKK